MQQRLWEQFAPLRTESDVASNKMCWRPYVLQSYDQTTCAVDQRAELFPQVEYLAQLYGL